MKDFDDFNLTLMPVEEPAPRPSRKPALYDWEQDASAFSDTPPRPSTAAASPAPRAFAFDLPLEAPLPAEADLPAAEALPTSPEFSPFDVSLEQLPTPAASPLANLPTSPEFAAYDISLKELSLPEQPAPEPAPAEEPAPPVPAPLPQPAPPQPQPTAAPLPRRTPNGRTVLISGGDRGIGAAAARAFWHAGYSTAILFHTNEEAARRLVDELGSDCMAVRCDVSSYDACKAALAAVRSTLGPVDVLVSNAGIAQQKLFTDITPTEWQQMLGVNLSGAFHLCQLALPDMIHQKWGRIITVSSMWGQTGGSCEVHYSAAKAGLIGLTKALAKEEGPSGITVNCVAPGVVDTDMMAAFTAEDKAALAEETPVGRLGTAEEVAQMILYLAGENAGYITGQVFGINGGLVI